MKYLLSGAVVWLSACTVSNPLFIGGTGDGAITLDSGGLVGDLASAPRDMATGACVEDERRCATLGSASQVCKSGAFVTERTCGDGTKCANGFCQPPAGGTGTLGQPCDQDQGFGPGPSENQCQGGQPQNSCQPFVGANASIEWVCGRPVGMGTPGTKCTLGSDCRTGFCGGNGFCFRSCKGDLDCPQTGGVPFRCIDVEIVVEGQKVTALSCAPQ